MNPLFNLISLVLLLPLAVKVSAQNFNVTVNETDTSQITFGGGAGDALICKFDENGNPIGSQGGCYNVFPQPPCSEFVAMGQKNTSFASWKFKGSALYIRSMLFQISPVFNVDIDGNVTEADGAKIGKNARAFDCFTLFSVDGLDPNVEHTVNLTVKGASPNRNTSLDRPGDSNTGPFSLISYTYTTSNQTNTNNQTNSNSNSNSTGPGQGPGKNGSAPLLISPEVVAIMAVSMAVSVLYLGLA